MNTSIQNLKDKMDHTINIWIEGLEQYDHDQLYRKVNQDSWSIGQVYEHLIEETYYYLGQIEECLSGNKHATENMSEVLREWFLRNSFPDKRLKGPPDLPEPHQPESSAALKEKLRILKQKIDSMCLAISTNRSTGKTKHPGHGFLNAMEWLQYAEMHMRHHFRQKKRIDNYLGKGV